MDNDQRNATNMDGETQAEMPRAASGTGADATHPATAVIGKATVAAVRTTSGTETAALAMIVVGTGERQPSVDVQTASDVRDSMIPCILAPVRPLTKAWVAHFNESINIAEPAEHLGPPDNSVTGVCGIPPQNLMLCG